MFLAYLSVTTILLIVLVREPAGFVEGLLLKYLDSREGIFITIVLYALVIAEVILAGMVLSAA